MKSSDFWRNLTALLVSSSFVAANIGYGRALELWTNGAEAILVFMGVGIGAKWISDRTADYVNRRYGGTTTTTTTTEGGNHNGNLE